MADAQQQQLVRLNVPSILGNSETYESIRTWITKIKTYFSRDVLFRKFLDDGECAAWNCALPNCGFVDDQQGPVGGRLTAPQKFAQLQLFIDNLLGFMPNVFLADSFGVQSRRHHRDRQGVLRDRDHHPQLSGSLHHTSTGR